MYDGGWQSVTTKSAAIIKELCDGYNQGVYQRDYTWYIQDDEDGADTSFPGYLMIHTDKYYAQPTVFKLTTCLAGQVHHLDTHGNVSKMQSITGKIAARLCVLCPMYPTTLLFIL